MGRRYKYIRRSSAGLIMASALWAGSIVAADDSGNKKAENNAVSSLKSVLERAGEQGFISIESNKQKPTPLTDSTQTPAPKTPRVEVMPPLGDINCNDTSALDLSSYASIESYDAIYTTKASLNKTETLEDVMPLARTYMALGLGAEMLSLVHNYKGHKARLIESMGRVIEGYPSDEDYIIIAQYSECNRGMMFWSEFARLSTLYSAESNDPFEFRDENQDFLNQLPTQIKKIATLRIGIYAAERNSSLTASSLLTTLAPRSKYGELPEHKDDSLLYLFGLIRQLKGDPKGLQIFKYLAERDGLYRVRSLQKLAEENLHNGAKLYENYTGDVASVGQQYNGQKESRQANLQLIKHSLTADRYTEAIEHTKREFMAMDVERVEAIIFAADRLQEALKDDLKTRQLLALNAYLYDPEFFVAYDALATLQRAAMDSAIHLNLPELVVDIFSNIKGPSADEEDILVYAETLIAAKHGEYDTVIKAANAFINNPKYQSLKLEAAVKSGNFKETVASLDLKTQEEARFALHSDIAWQNSQWAEAKMALEALADKKPDPAISAKIALANYMGKESRAYVNRALPKTAADLDLLRAQLEKDITLVKGYISNG